MKEPRGKWEKELYSSQLYRMFHKVQNGDVEKVVGKAVDAAEKTVRKVEKVVDDAVTGRQETPKPPRDYTPPGYPGGYHPPQTPAGYPGGYHPPQRNNGTGWNGNPGSYPPPPPPQKAQSPYAGAKEGQKGYAYGASKKKKEVPEGMRRVRRPAVAKYYITGGAALLLAFSAGEETLNSTGMPLYVGGGLLGIAVLLIVVFVVSSLIFRGKWVLEPIPQEEKPAPKPSGNPEVDKVVEEGSEYLRQLRKADEDIEDEEISQAIVRMEEISFQIFAYVCDHPNKVGQIRKFMNYYLPTTIKLLNSYHRLSQQDVQGENIQGSMVEIERIMQTIVKAFEKQLDALFQDEAMDISADITVLEGMMAQEGISSEDDDEEETEGPELKL